MKIKVIEKSMLTPFEESTLSDLNDIRGGWGVCIKHGTVVILDCTIEYCGVKIGCVLKDK